uniref:Uncharacterized protein n=1 Tax=Steinernema glaseri TaxID=37863 RepID=A0A1I7ZFM2_9BILA
MIRQRTGYGRHFFKRVENFSETQPLFHLGFPRTLSACQSRPVFFVASATLLFLEKSFCGSSFWDSAKARFTAMDICDFRYFSSTLGEDPCESKVTVARGCHWYKRDLKVDFWNPE